MTQIIALININHNNYDNHNKDERVSARKRGRKGERLVSKYTFTARL